MRWRDSIESQYPQWKSRRFFWGGEICGCLDGVHLWEYWDPKIEKFMPRKIVPGEAVRLVKQYNELIDKLAERGFVFPRNLVDETPRAASSYKKPIPDEPQDS
ncbi:MAG: hypothetical protein LBB26_02270 [Puniceicoccales bacterium]|jgi:hypothetical protein|nr:hypothetical protein [Puniceicoccales bacterium]